jgi:replicative DNA helicase
MELPNLNKARQTRRKPSTELNPLVYGKVPPQAKELEEAVLGAIMLEKGAFEAASEVLRPECFYLDAHQRIFRVMQALSARSVPVDLLTVVEELRSREELEMIGGAYYVTRLTNMVVSSAHIKAHCHIILQKFLQRELIRLSGEVISEAFEESADVFDLLDVTETKLFEITNNYLRKNFDEFHTVLVKTIERIEDLRKNNEDITGVTSGFPSLDHVTYGWQQTDLIILAARPSVGKTAFALNLARNAALHASKPTPVAFFSLEMSAAQLAQRILSAESEIQLEKIARGKLEDYEVQQLYKKGIDPLTKAPLFIDDSPALNIFELRAKARRLKTKYQVGLIIIDYLQLMSGSGENRNTNREQEISNISRNLKGLAKELNIPIIALSQLSREVEKRKEGGKMPQLSDLRESGAIEQDADMVMFLYRPEYHEINANEFGESNRGETHIKIAKHRNGSLETIKLRALLHIQKFVEDKFDDPPAQGGFPGGGNWRPVTPSEMGGGPKVFIEKGSRMNDSSFGSETPF